MTDQVSSCPLCCSENTVLLERLPFRKITDLYEKYLQVRVDHLMQAESLAYCVCKQCDLRFFSPPYSGDERFYNALQQYAWYYAEEKKEYAHAASHIKSEDALLDIGAGRGAFARMVPQARYTGLEFSSEARNLAEREGTRVINQSVEEHSLTHSGTYDVIVSFQVLEHVPKPREFLLSAAKCLKPGGKLILAVPSFDGFVGRSLNAVLNLPPHHVSHWSDKALASIGRLLQMEIVDFHHERVSEMHRKWFLQSEISSNIRRVLRRRSTLVDLSFAGKVLERSASSLAGLLNRVVFWPLAANGHTVTIVLRKAELSESRHENMRGQ